MSLRNQTKLAGDKAWWRDHFKDLLQREAPQSSVQIHQQICENLRDYLQDKSGIWAGYLALNQEPDLSPIYHQTPHIQWAYPRMEADHLIFYISQNFIKGPFGVMEPSEDSQKVHLEDLDGVLLPGLGFNKKGHRLGKGRGFYDRALEAYTGTKVGVCFSCQVVDEDIPEEQHDIRVDALVTEEEYIICS
jgi:5-formyltetrahydrofolate cyclo-ligase